jgi:hypothetical protein
MQAAAPLHIESQTDAIREWGRARSYVWEKHRRAIVRLVGAVYWLLIFEGVLRKWVLPQFGKQLFFVRDPLVLLIYVLVLARRTRLGQSRFLEIGAAFGIAGLVLSAVQLVTGTKLPFYFLVYGWRNYFLYLPLAFVIARYFNLWDLAQLARRTLIVCIPMAALVFMQLQAGPRSPINRGLGKGINSGYLVHTSEYGVVRPAGTFTSDQGLTTFSASALAMALSFWVLPVTSRPVGRLLLLVASACNLMCIGLSGSRGVLLWAAVIVGGALCGLFFVRPKLHFRATLLIVALLAGGAISLPILFPRPTQAFLARWQEAGDAESKAYGGGGVMARAAYEALSFRLLVVNTPAAGYGLGSAGNAAWELGVRNDLIFFHNQDEVNAAETDWGRNILELGPVLGCAFVLFRLSMVAFLLWTGLQTTRKTGHSFPWLFGLYVSVVLGFWQITGNGTLNGYGWLFVGFALAATRAARRYERELL